MAVVSDVRIGHQKISISNPRDTIFLVSTPVDGHSLAEQVVITDFNASWSALVAEVLGFAPDDCTREEAVSFADCGMADNHHITVQDASSTQNDVGTNDTEGTDFDVAAQLRLGIDLSEWRNARGHEVAIQSNRKNEMSGRCL